MEDDWKKIRSAVIKCSALYRITYMHSDKMRATWPAMLDIAY